MSYYQDEAVAEVLRDVDSLMDWAASECMGAEASKWPHIKEASAEDFKHVTVRNLFGLLFDAGQSKSALMAARDEITNRYLALPSTCARINALADKAETEQEHEALFNRLTGYQPWNDRRAA